MSHENSTVTPKFSMLSKLKNHMDTSFTNAKNAMNAIRLAIMAPIFPITLTAPIEMASNILLASL